MKLRPVITWAIVAIALIAAIGLTIAARPTDLASANDDIPLAKVSRGDLDLKVYTTGELRASHFAALTAPAIGGGALKITHLLHTGARVRKGEIVVEFDPIEQRYTVEQSRSELLQAEQAVRALAWNGRHLVIGFAQGQIPKLPLNLVLLKSANIQGVFWGAHTGREPHLHRANMDQLLAWAAAGRLKPHIHRVYRFDEISDALRAIARREVRGKAILVP